MNTSPTPLSLKRSLRFRVAWQRHKLAGFLAALLLMVAGTTAIFLKVRSSYSVEAVFQVAPSYQKNLAVDKELELQSNSQYREFVNHLSRSILRYDVLERAFDALQKLGIDPRLPSEDTRRWIERQQRTVYILAIPDTYMVRVGLTAHEPEHLHQIVNAIMDSFLETTRNEQIYGSDERSRVLLERMATVQSEVASYEKRRAELAQFLGLTTFGENTTNPYDLTLAQAREKLVLATIERSRAQATLTAFERQREVPAAAGRSVLEMRLQDNGLQAMRNEVIKRNEELQRITSGLAEGHPARRPALAEQEDMRQRLARKEAEFEGAALSNSRARFVATLEETLQVEKELSARVRDLEGQATRFASVFREAMSATGEIKKRELELTEIRSRLNFLATESNAIGFTRLISQALPAVTPQGIGKVRLLLALLLLSSAVAFVLPLAMDLLDPHVIVVDDAEKAMRIGAAAWFVDRQDRPTHILWADQARRFASTLRRNCARGARNVYSFSSVKVGGGTSTLVKDMALTLVELGTRTLVIDANSHSGESVFASDQPGLTDVLIGKVKPIQCLTQQEHQGTLLNVVPYGLSTDSGIKRLDVLRAALDEWSGRFDMVLVDLPPLLPSPDAELLIDTIGQVFLVVQAEKQLKSEVVRSRIQIERMDPEAVGLVVNRMPLDAGGDTLKTQLMETITGSSFSHYLAGSRLPVYWNLLLLRLQMWRTRWC